ncbi:ParB N-terminal domain-containing protein [Streptomyces sp. NRRL S-31]|uniref:ParB N-terminal domain-containing protein n=1 Tax=Streptomyces sp. NRRL S-31 TaxID=1463898 RepID=UPI001C1E5F1B|nr:ParB N-terminal domain-containing protein [Streptomyces sp. NRRL S-31]
MKKDAVMFAGMAPEREEEFVGNFAMRLSSVQVIPLSWLEPADSPRLEGESVDHIKILSQSNTGFPPIIVQRSTMRVIDGMHRVSAARARGDSEIAAQFFEGDTANAFVLAVQANIAHGLPLSLGDRTKAAERIITSHPQWSDRVISSATGLSARSVSAVRRRVSDLVAQPSVRIGRDGRVRPINASFGRRLIGELLRQRPDASLREIARAAGVAPSTVLKVRKRIEAEEGRTETEESRAGAPRPASRTSPAPNPAPAPTPAVGPDSEAALRKLRKDPSLRLNEAGRTLLHWLSARPHGEAGEHAVSCIPDYQVETVMQLAMMNARAWQRFAEQLKER